MTIGHPVCFLPPPVDPPQITQQPADELNVNPGSSVTFMVTATTVIGALTYQWQLDGNSFPLQTGANGATTRTLILSNVQESNEGNYSCIITNDGGSVNSDLAQLTICKCKISITDYAHVGSTLVSFPSPCSGSS